MPVSGRELAWGELFNEADWTLLEQSPGLLHDGMRVTAWVCQDGETPPLIDWMPQQQGN